MNKTAIDILKNSLTASLGLVMFGAGVYLVIQANIGASPWDVFCIGLSQTLGIKYGNASIMISAVLIVIDVIMGEKIGIGTILDAVIVGKTVDLLNFLNLVPAIENNIVLSIVLLVAAFALEGYSQYFYMKAALSCGPRDSFQIALGRRMPKVPIGVVNIIILLTVFVIGYFLGGPIGLGTILTPFCAGLSQQFFFTVKKFDPKKTEHQNLIESLKVILRRS